MSLLIISSSLNPSSNSRKLAEVALVSAQKQNIESSFLDLRDFPLEVCDGGSSFKQASLEPLNVQIKQAKAMILCGPVYVYSMSAALSNLVEHCGRSLEGKPVGLMAAAGGKSSYMAVLGMANSLMLDYRCPIIPKYVYADSGNFDKLTGEADDDVRHRIDELVKTTHHWGEVL